MPPFVVYSEARRSGLPADQARKLARVLTEPQDGPLQVTFRAFIGIGTLSAVAYAFSLLF